MILAYLGRLGSCKSEQLVERCYGKSLRGVKIISNIHLDFPGDHGELWYLPFEEIPDTIKTCPQDFRNAILFIDELHMLVDARRSSSGLNVDFTMFATQLGKLNCSLYYSAHVINSQIDVRIRELGDRFVFVERWYWHPIQHRWKAADPELPRKLRLGYFIGGDAHADEGPLVPIAVKAWVITPGLGGKIKMTQYKRVIDFRYFSMYDTEQFMYLDRSQFLSGSTSVTAAGFPANFA